jgi:chaperone required for assembly of F1-ATPase
MKRFCKDAAVTANNGVALDGKALKTPAGTELILPSRDLAQAVAQEWRAQGDHIAPQTMPLTTLANTAIDGVAPRPRDIVDAILAFANHDLLCYRADGPAELVRRQAEAWDPMLDWAESRHGARLVVQNGIVSVRQLPSAIGALRSAVEALGPFELAALHVVASICASLVLALAVANRCLSGEEAFALSRIDERFQAETWGADMEAETRAKKLLAELQNAERFLGLL